MSETLLVLLAGVVAGALNAVGGGGTFVALPALVAAGQSPVTANATSTVALVPGAVAAAWVYRRQLTPVGGASMTALTAASAVGGVLGAGLLLALPSESFDAAVPWLLAFATVLLAFGRRLSGALSSAPARGVGMGSRAVVAGQFLLAVYGGYFGGAVGIMMLALWSIGLFRERLRSPADTTWRACIAREPLEAAHDLDDWVLRHPDGDPGLGAAPVSGGLARTDPTATHRTP